MLNWNAAVGLNLSGRVKKDCLAKALEINVPPEPDAISACTRKLADITKNILVGVFAS
jgi:hypothetical protein